MAQDDGFAGRFRHYWPTRRQGLDGSTAEPGVGGEWLHVFLRDSSGVPVTGVAATDVDMYVVPPSEVLGVLQKYQKVLTVTEVYRKVGGTTQTDEAPTGTGTADSDPFEATLAKIVAPTTLSGSFDETSTGTTRTFTDNGKGVLVGTGVTGTINYETKAISISSDANDVDDSTVLVSYFEGATLETWQEEDATNFPGLYRVMLWGDDNSQTQKSELEYVGRWGFELKENSPPPAFEEVVGHFEVAGDYSPEVDALYIPGSAGSDVLKLAVALDRWNGYNRLDISEGKVDELTVKVWAKSDLDAETLVDTFTKTGADFAIVNGVAFAEKTNIGLNGGRMLALDVSGTVKGQPFYKSLVLPGRFPA